jgi:hypothetical protein
VSEPAISLAFFDPDRQLYGIARSDATLLFDDTRPEAVPAGPSLTPANGSGLRAELPGHFVLELEPVSEPAELGPGSVRVCRVRGELAGRRVRGLGTLGETRAAPAWAELDALRAISVLLDERNAVLALALRPRGAPGHGRERVSAWLLRDGELARVEEARLSTVYDRDGRQRSAALELWLPGEDVPRRVSGSVAAGSSLELEGLHVQAAVFRWRMERREGAGEYQLVLRDQPPAAA